jgi:hypothetical protein
VLVLLEILPDDHHNEDDDGCTYKRNAGATQSTQEEASRFVGNGIRTGAQLYKIPKIRMILVHYSFVASLLFGFLPFLLPFSL